MHSAYRIEQTVYNPSTHRPLCQAECSAIHRSAAPVTALCSSGLVSNLVGNGVLAVVGLLDAGDPVGLSLLPPALLTSPLLGHLLDFLIVLRLVELEPIHENLAHKAHVVKDAVPQAADGAHELPPHARWRRRRLA